MAEKKIKSKIVKRNDIMSNQTKSVNGSEQSKTKKKTVAKSTKRQISIKLDKKDYITIFVTLVIVGLIGGYVALKFFEPFFAILIGFFGGLLSGIGINALRKGILAEVTFPTPKGLAQLTMFVIILMAIFAAIIVALDFVFVGLRDIIL